MISVPVGVFDQGCGAVAGTLDACQVARLGVGHCAACGDESLHGRGSVLGGFLGGCGELEGFRGRFAS
ncbi:hypothetical protein [Streptosporangium canum]|uniref:hypothetical protein n=1 Tax=Streptosporangium canum TaxID=324952 RepID=UPI0033A6B8F1